MSRVRIVNSPGEVGEAAIGYGTTIEIDGKRMENVRSITVSPITVDAVISVAVEVLAVDTEIDLPANVDLRVVHLSECPSCRAVSKLM